ncbi:MAG: AAA family ATPase [Fimbriimonadia bacterium]|nr:AAA family ATPase [Fimbriimonadia bacterium]
MQINQLTIHNFRSFRHVDIALKPMSVIVGANASGKSNLVQLFRFLRDLAREGLANAVSLQGGADYLLNLQLGKQEPLKVSLKAANSVALSQKGTKKRVEKIEYSLELRFNASDNQFEFQREEVLFEASAPSSKKSSNGSIFPSSFKVVRVGGDVSIEPFIVEDSRISRRVMTIPRDYSVLQLIPYPIAPLMSKIESSEGAHIHTLFKNISIFDFYPKMLKQPAPVRSRASLEEDGSNLAIVLEELLRNEESRLILLNALEYFLPFITDIQVQHSTDRSVLIQLAEKYHGQKLLPALLLSDGTLEILAIIIALRFSSISSPAVFEEPERNLHPSLVSRLVGMFQEESKTRQVIFTTHNPEVLRHTHIDSLFLVSRDKDGFSAVTRPAERERVQVFLKNELGLDDLFVDNLLEV